MFAMYWQANPSILLEMESQVRRIKGMYQLNRSQVTVIGLDGVDKQRTAADELLGAQHTN